MGIKVNLEEQKPMKNLKRKALIGASILVLLLSVLFVVRFITNPYYIVGLPTPLFYIRNMDEGAHELRVEVFDSENNSVLNETYELAPGEKISYPKPFRSREMGVEMVDYTFKFTLDGRFTEKYSTKVDSWGTVEVELYADYSEGQPLSIVETAV